MFDSFFIDDNIKTVESTTERNVPKKRRIIPGQCKICGKSTKNIAAHRKIHTEEKKYECQVGISGMITIHFDQNDSCQITVNSYREIASK